MFTLKSSSVDIVSSSKNSTSMLCIFKCHLYAVYFCDFHMFNKYLEIVSCTTVGLESGEFW